MTVKAIVFDIGGVLEVSASGAEPALLFGRFVSRWEARLGIVAGRLNDCLEERRADGLIGRCSEEEWIAHLRERVSALQSASPSEPWLESFLREFWDVYCGQANHEMVDWLRARRPDYKTALLSNSFVGARAAEESRYSFSSLVDLIVYSHEEGISKPERAIYERTWTRLGIHPEEMLFLDDLQSNIDAARTLGIQAVFFENNRQAIAALEAVLR